MASLLADSSAGPNVLKNRMDIVASTLDGGDVAQRLIADQRIRFFAFTGSSEVGRNIQQTAGLRRTRMEPGSITFTILCEDTDLDRALPKIVGAGYRKAGQVCTSVRILLVAEREIGYRPKFDMMRGLAAMIGGNTETVGAQI